MAITRIPVPKDIQAEVLFKSNHLCAICQKEIGVHIAHMDNDNKNFNESNLIVLCLQHHDETHSHSPLSHGFSIEELKKYKESWEATVAKRRKSLQDIPSLRLIRFDGPDVNTVYLEVEPRILRGFQDSLTFNLLRFDWGNVDVYPEEHRKKFQIESSLLKARQCKRIRLKFSNDTFAREIYLIWEDGRKHHIPDPETYKEIVGSHNYQDVESLDYTEFNAIPHGRTLLSIFDVRKRDIFKDAWIEQLNKKENHDKQIS